MPKATPKHRVRAPMASQILGRLRKAIVSGELRSGEALRQDELAARFGTSKIPVREALQRLEGEGLVKSIPHRGVFVSELSAAELREICEIRIDLESRALRLAIPQLDKAAIARAKTILDEAESDQNYLTNWSARNWEFHSTLYRAADRPRLLQMIEGLHDQTERYLQLHVAVSDYRRTGEREHRELLRLAARGDVKNALKALAEHIEVVYTLLEPYLTHRAATTSLRAIKN